MSIHRNAKFRRYFVPRCLGYLYKISIFSGISSGSAFNGASSPDFFFFLLRSPRQITSFHRLRRRCRLTVTLNGEDLRAAGAERARCSGRPVETIMKLKLVSHGEGKCLRFETGREGKGREGKGRKKNAKVLEDRESPPHSVLSVAGFPTSDVKDWSWKRLSRVGRK